MLAEKSPTESWVVKILQLSTMAALRSFPLSCAAFSCVKCLACQWRIKASTRKSSCLYVQSRHLPLLCSQCLMDRFFFACAFRFCFCLCASSGLPSSSSSISSSSPSPSSSSSGNTSFSMGRSSPSPSSSKSTSPRKEREETAAAEPDGKAAMAASPFQPLFQPG